MQGCKPQPPPRCVYPALNLGEQRNALRGCSSREGTPWPRPSLWSQLAASTGSPAPSLPAPPRQAQVPGRSRDTVASPGGLWSVTTQTRRGFPRDGDSKEPRVLTSVAQLRAIFRGCKSLSSVNTHNGARGARALMRFQGGHVPQLFAKSHLAFISQRPRPFSV